MVDACKMTIGAEVSIDLFNWKMLFLYSTFDFFLPTRILCPLYM